MIAGLIGLLVVLAVMVKANPESDIDRIPLDWIRGREIAGLNAYFTGVSAITDARPRLAISAGLVLVLAAGGRRRDAVAVTLIAIIVGFAGLWIDTALGDLVERGRPIPEPTAPSFPSGHTYGSILLFGFTGFLLHRIYRRRTVVWPLLAMLALFTISVGASRIFLSAHWPSDVVGGGLLGVALLIVMIRLYAPCERVVRGLSTRLAR